MFLLLMLVSGARLSAQTVSEQYLLAAANHDRAQRGVPPVRLDARLSEAAAFHARQMAAHGSISHQFAGEPDLSARASAAGARFSLVTENVAEAPTSALIHDLWMHSEGHRTNLLDPKVDSIGIAVIAQGGQLYAVEDFARTVQNLSLDEQEAAVARLLQGTGLALAEDADQRNARRTCALATGYAGTRQPYFVMRYTAAALDKLPPELTSRLATGKFREAAVGACLAAGKGNFTSYNIAILLYP